MSVMLTDFTHSADVSIVDFEQLNAGSNKKINVFSLRMKKEKNAQRSNLNNILLTQSWTYLGGFSYWYSVRTPKLGT